MSISLCIDPDKPWLAPLAGFSDLPFRLLCREQGCHAACTEMVSAKGLIFQNAATKRILATNPADTPLVVQVYGAEPDIIQQAVQLLAARNFSYFDLNAGCSVPKVAKTGSGAALLRSPERLLLIARQMIREAGPGHVGVKLRLGWRPDEEVFLELGPKLEDAGVGWLTLHPRWATQGFSGQADWNYLTQLRRAVSIPVIASGDLFTAEDALRCLEQTGVRGVMFARGALWDPGIFTKFRALRASHATGCFPAAYSIGIVRRHVELSREHCDDKKALLTMRTIAPRYLRHFSGAKALRTRLTLVQSWAELEDLLDELSSQVEHVQ